MRLYSYFASQIDFFKNDCVKFLGLNSACQLSYEDLSRFRDNLEDLLDSLNERPLCDYFAKK